MSFSRRTFSRAVMLSLAAGALAKTSSTMAAATSRLVHTITELDQAVASAKPGAIIVMANGYWKDARIVFNAQGMAGMPIELVAETPGQVILTGRSNLKIAGDHLVVRGLVFRDGYSPDSEVINFIADKKSPSSNFCRVSECEILNFNEPDKTADGHWVSLHGRFNRVDHCHFEGKSNKGVTVCIHLDRADSDENHHRIDHNYFGPRPLLGRNGAETIKIGAGAYSHLNSSSVIENNLFEECNGELEIISIKSCRNVVRGNIFLRSAGTLTFRQGRFNLVEGNVFLGEGAPDTGGIRIINTDQTVRNNFLSGLRGNELHSAFSMVNGVPGRDVGSYGPVMRALVENNSFHDVSAITFGARADAERSQAPRESIFRNNLLVDCSTAVLQFHSATEGITFSGNVMNRPALLAPGFETRALAKTLQFDPWGMPALPTIAGVGSSLVAAPFNRNDVGPPFARS